jgi:glycosyltransferase involved in cell wall biosynthesis
MKVLHLNGYLSGGGVEKYLTQLFPLLQAHDIGNVLIYGEKPEGPDRLEAVNLNYIEGITRLFCKNHKQKLQRVRKIIDQERPDIVYLHQVANASLVTLVTSLLPTVKFVHDFKLICPDGKKTLKTRGRMCGFPLGYRCQLNAYCYRCMPRNPFIGMPLIKNCITMASLHEKKSHMVVASKFMKNVLIYNGFREEKIDIIPYFTPLPLPEMTASDSEIPRILALGRITREKGFDCLLQAYSAIQNHVLLTIVGDGPDLMNLKSLAEKLKLSSKVEFPGWLSHEALDRIYRQSALVVVPSIWPEPFGIVGIEAMAYRKPVVAFDVGGISQWLKDRQTGYLVQPGNIRDLTDKMNLILNNRKLAIEMGYQGRMSVEKYFSEKKHHESLLRLFQEAVKSHDS